MTSWNDRVDFWVNANDAGYWSGTSQTYPLSMHLVYGSIAVSPGGSIPIPKMAAKNIAPGKTPTPTVSGITASTVNLAWSAPSAGTSPITGYDVQWNTAKSETGATTQSQGTGLTKTVTGLKADTTNYFRVRAKNAVGLGGWSDWATGKTLPGVRVGKGSSFVTAQALVGKSTFVTPQILVGKGGSFVSPA